MTTSVDEQIIKQIIAQLKTMPENLQYQVLKFARDLTNETQIQGVSGKELLHFAGAISPDDLALMNTAIQEDCGQVDADEW
ncbi:hypothetical protein WJM97_16760 [Okeanomitos corallinicola TIOX110]|uniref:DUF2281 domain-containing protein n=1 Tax=Okeanomitos corallinicola TIOX110 TaxID=3133117 RepID=A0ABZ2UPW0_9CYAN